MMHEGIKLMQRRDAKKEREREWERVHRMRVHILYLFMEINYPSFVLVYANDNNEQTKNKRSRDQWNLKLSAQFGFHEYARVFCLFVLILVSV